MNAVKLNYRIFDDIHKYQYVFPTLTYLIGQDKLADVQLVDIGIVYNIDFDTAMQTIQVVDTKNDGEVLYTSETPLPCVANGPEAVKGVIDLLKASIGDERALEIQLAINQTRDWFCEKMGAWLAYETTQVKTGMPKHKISPEFCTLFTQGM